MMKISVVALVLVGVVAVLGKPGPNKEWRWRPRLPTVTPNRHNLPFDKFVENYPKIPYVAGTEKVAGCGTTKMSKIVGGTEAVPHSFPWQVALYIDDAYFCGGAIISKNWVLTAGHCLDGARKAQVVAGAHNLNVNEPSQVSMFSTNLKTHENYNSFRLANDVALLRLPTPLTFNAYISPVCLPSYSDANLPVGTTVNPSGWGKTSDGFGGISNTLNNVYNTIISQSKCQDTYGSIITSSVVCTDTTGAKGTCNGDSGGPMNYVERGVTYTRGITSFVSSAGCKSGLPDGFTRVTSFLAWIETHTGIAIDA